MFKIAIVEDDIMYIKQLSEYVRRYAAENQENIDIRIFSDGIDIADKYKADYDIIFMDIQMKIMDGLKAAQNIRKLDENVIIIFLTNMAQYAIQGYAVNAMDFVLKPLSYFAFSEELAKAIRRLKERVQAYTTIKRETGILRLEISRITYIECLGHNVVFHTKNNSYESRATMKSIEQQMTKYKFFRCNSGYIVNLRHVESVEQNIVTVSGHKLQISRHRKKYFMYALTDYVGG